MLTYTRRFRQSQAGNNSVCKSWNQQDRTFTETIEKMKQPKSTQHREKISKSITNWWEEKTRRLCLNRQQLSKDLSGSFLVNTGSFFVSGSDNPSSGDYVLSTSGSINTTEHRVFEQGTSVVDNAYLSIVFGG